MSTNKKVAGASSSRAQAGQREQDAPATLVPELRFPEFQTTGGWSEKKLGQILSIGSGRDHKHLPDGDVPVYGSGGFMRSVNQSLYEGESVCIGRKGTIDNPIFLSGKFWTVDTLFFTHSFKNSIPKFVYALFLQIKWQDHNAAGGIPSLSKTDIQNIKVAIPTPAEQQKIADCLGSLDDLIAAHSRKLAALQDHKKGLHQQLFPAEGETTPKLRFPEFEGEWQEKPLKKLATYQNGKAYEKHILDDGKYVVVNSRFVSTEGMVQKFTNEEFCPAKKGDVLMVLSDLPKGRALAKCFFVDEDKKYGVNQRVARLRSKDIHEKFLFYRLNRHSRLLAYDDGITQTHLSKSDVEDCLLAIPDTQQEQQKIADCLGDLDALITTQTEQIAALKEHKNGLMQQLFPNPEDQNTL